MTDKRYQLDYDLWQLFLNVRGEELSEHGIRYEEIARPDEPFITVEFDDERGVDLVEQFITQEASNNKIVKLEVVKDDLTKKEDWLKEQSLSSLVTILGDLKAKKSAIAKEEKQVNAEISAVEVHILPLLKEQELTKATVDTQKGMYTLSVNETVHPQPDPEKWDDIFRWIIENGRTELLMKKLNSAPYRESLESENLETPPEVKSYTKTTLNLRKI